MVWFHVSPGFRTERFFKLLIARRRQMHMYMPLKAIGGAAQSLEVPSTPVMEFSIHFYTYFTGHEILLGGRSTHTE